MKLCSMPNARLLFVLFALSTCGALDAAAQAYTVARALAYQRAQDWPAMFRYVTAWTQAQPDSADAWALLGNYYFIGMNQPEKAIAPMRRAVEIQPSAPAWHALGLAYVKSNQLGEGVAAIKKAIALNPNQPTYYNNLAAAYSDGNAVASAMAALDQEKALAQRLNNASVWWTLGNGYAKLTDLNSSIAAYRKVLQLDPGFAYGWTNLGVVLQYSGDTDGARAAYRKGQALGDPLAGQDAAQMEADLRAQAATAARQQETIRRGQSAIHMMEVMHMRMPGQMD